MLGTLRSPAFRHLSASQIVALAGTGLATVAPGLQAWQMAGNDAGAVWGAALAIKMIDPPCPARMMIFRPNSRIWPNRAHAMPSSSTICTAVGRKRHDRWRHYR